jgi:hypothetical protein
MRRDDERALYGLADDDDRPDPANARDAAEFVALLGALVEHSGLSLPEIEELAASKGYVLPEQIIATALSHDALPPEELVVALVRSIGINDREVKYWVEVLWRLESRAPYNPAQANQEQERKAPRDIDQIYGAKDEPGPSEPYVVPAPYDVAQVPDADEDDEEYEEPYAVPMFLTTGQVPDTGEHQQLPPSYGALRGAGLGEVYEPDSHPGEPPHGFAAVYETAGYDEPHVQAEPVSPAASRGYADGPLSHAIQERGRHRRADEDDDEYVDGGPQNDAQLVPHYETQDNWMVRPERPRIRYLATRSIRRVKQKAKWPLPVAVGLSVLLVILAGAWMAFGGSGGGKVPPAVAGGPPGSTQNQTSTASETTGVPGSPTATDGVQPTFGPEVLPGTGGNPPPVNPNNPNPNPQPTTQGPPQPTQTQPGNYNTQLSGTGSTVCTNEGGQWRVRILVSVTVSDPPPGLVPQGQAGLSGSMQGFSLSGSGSSYSGSATVSVGPSSSPSVGTVQWLVTMSVPGGRTARDESMEGYSCA